MIEPLFVRNRGFVNKPGGEPSGRTRRVVGSAQGLKSVSSFFFTATPLMVAYSGRPFLYGG